MLEEANKRLIEMQNEQLQVNRALLETLNQLKTTGNQSDSDLLQQFKEAMLERPVLASVDVSSGHSGQLENVYTPNLIIESGKEYRRDSHPALFAVVDYLEAHEGARNEGVRRIAELVTHHAKTPVGKSWAAVAKNYWQSKR